MLGEIRRRLSRLFRVAKPSHTVAHFSPPHDLLACSIRWGFAHLAKREFYAL